MSPNCRNVFAAFSVPKGQFIDNDGDIDYEQLYAQVLYELRKLKAPYRAPNPLPIGLCAPSW